MKTNGDKEDYITGTGQRLKVHNKSVCAGNPCPIHNPSNHPMIEFPTHWRDDRGIMERICPHGVGHPDPDDFSIRNGHDKGVHGCDGCCTGDYPIKSPEPPVLPKGQTIEPEMETVDFRVGRQRDHLIYYGDGSCYDTDRGEWVTLVEAIPVSTMHPDDVLVLKLPQLNLPKKVLMRFIHQQVSAVKQIFPGQKVMVLADGIEIELKKVEDNE